MRRLYRAARVVPVRAAVARILTARPDLAAPTDLRERMSYQTEVIRTIARAHRLAISWGLVSEVGRIYAEYVPHVEVAQ